MNRFTSRSKIVSAIRIWTISPFTGTMRGGRIFSSRGYSPAGLLRPSPMSSTAVLKRRAIHISGQNTATCFCGGSKIRLSAISWEETIERPTILTLIWIKMGRFSISLTLTSTATLTAGTRRILWAGKELSVDTRRHQDGAYGLRAYC